MAAANSMSDRPEDQAASDNEKRAVAIWFPRAMAYVVDHRQLLKKHLPTSADRGGIVGRAWGQSEDSAQLCQGCEKISDCRQTLGSGSGARGLVRVISPSQLYVSTALRICRFKKAEDSAAGSMWTEKRYASKTLAGFRVNAKNKVAFEYCKMYLQRLDHNLASGVSFTISGPTGVGKTHLASAVFRETMMKAHEVSGSFVYMPEFVQRIRDHFGEKGGEPLLQFIEATMGCRFVVLDNFEFRQVTDWLIDTLNMIVDYRYQRMLPTIITTGWEAAQMAKALEPKLPSRLVGMGEWKSIQDRDQRRVAARSRKGGS